MSLETETLLTLVNSGGVVAVLTIQVVLFLRGVVVPREVVEQIIETTVKRVMLELKEHPTKE